MPEKRDYVCTVVTHILRFLFLCFLKIIKASEKKNQIKITHYTKSVLYIENESKMFFLEEIHIVFLEKIVICFNSSVGHFVKELKLVCLNIIFAILLLNYKKRKLQNASEVIKKYFKYSFFIYKFT